MAKRTLIFLGLLLFVVVVGALGYRVYSDPNRADSYRSIFQGETSSADPDARRAPAPSSERYVDANDAQAQSKNDRRAARNERIAGIKLFEPNVDVLNILVGVIGIGLAIWGSRMRSAASG